MTTKTVPIAPLGETFHGMAAPNKSKPAHHAITTHLPTWDMWLQFSKKDPAFFSQFVDFYPRLIPHRDIKQLIGAVLEYVKAEDMMALPYPSLEAAQKSVEYVTANPRTDKMDSIPKDQIFIRAFEMNELRFYMVFFDLTARQLVMPWWLNTGTGISSRFAEDALNDPASLREVDIAIPRPQWSQKPTQALRKRIADLLERDNRVGPARKVTIVPEDIYLYATGMTAIFGVHSYLLTRNESRGKTVLFGLAFHQTIHIFEFFGPGVKELPLATEYEELETYLKEEAEKGTPVQAIWTELPSNPLLLSADLWKLRDIADRFKTVLIIDDTVGSFCNVDVTPVADIIITSLTKSVSGYADTMGGSAVLNPNSSFYAEFKPIFENFFGNDLYVRDAQQLLDNSEDYMVRSTTLNNNAAMIVDYLHKEAQDPASPISKVYYPTVNQSKANFDAFKRPATTYFTPGYGCLFSVELSTKQRAIAFFDNLKVTKGPHLGAHGTIALPYVQTLYSDRLEEIRPTNMRPEQLRISVGLEPAEELLEIFKEAVRSAGQVK